MAKTKTKTIGPLHEVVEMEAAEVHMTKIEVEESFLVSGHVCRVVALALNDVAWQSPVATLTRAAFSADAVLAKLCPWLAAADYARFAALVEDYLDEHAVVGRLIGNVTRGVSFSADANDDYVKLNAAV